MQTLAQIAIYIINTIGTLYLGLVLLRFLCQLVRADYYNPISKSLVKLTNPLLVPLRKVVPGFFGIDLAAILLALILQALLLQVLLLLYGVGLVNPAALLAWSFVSLLGLIVSIYYFGMFIIIIASWIAPHSYNPALSLLQQIIDPLLAPLRKIIPPLGMLDLSPMIFIMILQIVRSFIIPAIAQAFGLIPGLAVGI